MKLPRILITAMRSGAGKTMLTCGILKAMKMQEINPASFKCGPDYIDPMFHKTVLWDTMMGSQGSLQRRVLMTLPELPIPRL